MPASSNLTRVATVVILGSILSVLDTTIINVALDSLSRDLHAPLSSVQWVATAYLLSLAAVIPVTGWAVRRYSARKLYLIAIVLFTAGSLLCALATSLPELIIFRVLQGIGGGMLVPVGQIILVKAAGPSNLPKAMSMVGVPVVLAPVFGPTLGGILLQTAGWHWIFMINVPIGVVAITVALRLLPHDRDTTEHSKRLDWTGLVLAASGTVGITYGLSESASAGSFTSSSVVIPVLLGMVLIAAFVWRSHRVDHPLLDLGLYRIRAFTSASIVTFCLGAVLFGSMILMPLYFQIARGQDAIHAGLLIIPQSVGGGIGMFLSSRATTRLGAGLTTLIGGLIMVVATIPFLFVNGSTSFIFLAICMVVRGTGIGLSVMPAMSAAYSLLTPEQVNDASPQLTVLQRVGGSLGTATFAVVLQNHLTSAHLRAGGVARAFDSTYLWVIALSILALLPTLALWHIERRAKSLGAISEVHHADLIEAA